MSSRNEYPMINYGYPLSQMVFSVDFPYENNNDYSYHSFHLITVFLFFGTQNYPHPKHPRKTKIKQGRPLKAVAPSLSYYDYQ